MVSFKQAWTDIMQLLTDTKFDCPFTEDETQKRLRAITNYLLLIIESLVEEGEENALEERFFSKYH